MGFEAVRLAPGFSPLQMIILVLLSSEGQSQAFQTSDISPGNACYLNSKSHFGELPGMGHMLTTCLLPSLACSSSSPGPPAVPARGPEASSRGSEALGESRMPESSKCWGWGQFPVFPVFLPSSFPI